MAKTYVISQSQQTTPTLWAGTNSGAIYVFNLLIPAGTRLLPNDGEQHQIYDNLCCQLQVNGGRRNLLLPNWLKKFS